MVEYDDYCNDEYPVLSFAYALYCDKKFSEAAHKSWIASLPKEPLTAAMLRAPTVYRGYLDDYTQNRKIEFPPGAEELITVGVATNPPEKKGYYSPNNEQALELVRYLIHELTGKAPAATAATQKAGKRGKPGKAKFNEERPLLSCLAMLFVTPNEESKADPVAFLKDKAFKGEDEKKEKEVLVDLVKKKPLTPAQTKVLEQGLVAEFTREPYVW